MGSAGPATEFPCLGQSFLPAFRRFCLRAARRAIPMTVQIERKGEEIDLDM